jgi:hypothetical protein
MKARKLLSINYRKALLLMAGLWLSSSTGAQIISTIAGNGIHTFAGDGGPATDASIYVDGGTVTADAAGNIYIADLDNNRIRKVTPGGIISTVAGNGINGYTGDGIPATDAELSREFAFRLLGSTLYNYRQ